MDHIVIVHTFTSTHTKSLVSGLIFCDNMGISLSVVMPLEFPVFCYE